jgi:hypothetical protein
MPIIARFFFSLILLLLFPGPQIHAFASSDVETKDFGIGQAMHHHESSSIYPICFIAHPDISGRASNDRKHNNKACMIFSFRIFPKLYFACLRKEKHTGKLQVEASAEGDLSWNLLPTASGVPGPRLKTAVIPLSSWAGRAANLQVGTTYGSGIHSFVHIKCLQIQNVSNDLTGELG